MANSEFKREITFLLVKSAILVFHVVHKLVLKSFLSERLFLNDKLLLKLT